MSPDSESQSDSELKLDDLVQLSSEKLDPKLPTPKVSKSAENRSPGAGEREHASDPSITATQQVDKPAPLSSHQLRRRRRNRSIVVAILLALVFLGTLVWSGGGFEENTDAEVLTIAPRVLFEDLCTEAKKSQNKIFHVTDFEVTDELVPPIGEFEWIETLIFDRGIVTDESIKTIARLPKLQHLRLRLSPIGDEGLKRLSNAQSLWYINLPHAECTAAGIAELAAIPRLRQLRIGSTTLGNEVTREIASIQSLRGVHLIGVAVTDEGLKTLAAMPHLESLYLDDSAVTEAGWDWLFREHPHLHVHIDQVHHDRDPKAHKHH